MRSPTSFCSPSGGFSGIFFVSEQSEYSRPCSGHLYVRSASLLELNAGLIHGIMLFPDDFFKVIANETSPIFYPMGGQFPQVERSR